MPQPLTYDFLNQIIEVPAPDTALDLQYLVNQTRDIEDNDDGITYPKILDAFGKQSLGGSSFVGITVQLLENWRIRFEARAGPTTEVMTISGGNLVKEGGVNPIAPSAFTTVTLAQSSSPTITGLDANTHLLYLMESMLGQQHKGSGNYYYWDPENGDDGFDGTTPANAVKTFATAQGLAADGNYDTIFAISSGTGGVTTVTETINISKNTLRLRGPGHSLQLIPTVDTSDTIVIAANNVDISGLYVSTASTGTPGGITVTGSGATLKNIWVTGVRGNGISFNSSSLSTVTECAIENAGLSGTGDGIVIGSGTIQTTVSKTIVTAGVNGIRLSGVSVADNIFEDNLIYNHTGYGFDIGSGVLRTGIRSGHTFSGNALGNTNDLGTDTFIDTQAGGASPSEIADSVWDEIISGHTTAGSAGRILRDTKTKATLASLK